MDMCKDNKPKNKVLPTFHGVSKRSPLVQKKWRTKNVYFAKQQEPSIHTWLGDFVLFIIIVTLFLKLFCHEYLRVTNGGEEQGKVGANAYINPSYYWWEIILREQDESSSLRYFRGFALLFPYEQWWLEMRSTVSKDTIGHFRTTRR